MIHGIHFDHDDNDYTQMEITFFEGAEDTPVDDYRVTKVNAKIEDDQDNTPGLANRYTEVMIAECGERFIVDLIDDSLYKLIPVYAHDIAGKRQMKNLVTNQK